MLRDITIGQYYPAESRVHELDPRVKIAAVFIYLISLFVFSSFIGYVVVTVFLVAAIIKSKVPFSYILKGLKPILFLLLFTAVFNIFGTKGDVLFEYKFITITWQGLRKGAFMSMRLIYLILGSSLLTYTTTPNQLTDGLETMLKPLEKIKVPVHDFAMMMSLALRFIPILLDEANRIISAQSSRGADFDEGTSAAPDEDDGVDFGAASGIRYQESLRSCHGHGVPVLSWRRWKDQDEASEIQENR